MNIFTKLYYQIILEAQRVFSFQGQYGYTEVIKNPTSSEILSLIKKNKGSLFAGIIMTPNDIYAFDRESEFHERVAKKLEIMEYIGGLYNGRDWFFVTETSKGRLKNNPIVPQLIKKFFPNIKEIVYHNQSEIGDWSNLGNPFQ